MARDPDSRDPLPAASDAHDASGAGDPSAGGAVLIYDGDCPFCRQFAKLVRLREAAGPVRLVNARDGGPEVDRLQADGVDFNEGNAFIYGGRVYVGADSMVAIALLTDGGGPMRRLLAWSMRDPRRARALYPVLRGLRNLALRVRCGSQIATPDA